MGRTVEFPSNGSQGTGYLAEAEGGGPAVVVIQEWWGLVPHIEDVCDRYATAGFTALAPDLYRGESTTEPDEAGKLMMSLNIERAAKDLGGAVDFLLGLDSVASSQVAVTGFCMGGKLAYFAAAARPDEVAAIAPFYGVVPWPPEGPDYTAMRCRVQGHYAEDDDFAPPDAVRELEGQLRDQGRDVEMFVYDGTQHAFFNDTRPDVYDAAASSAAWDRTLAFFRESLTSV
ncbi:MAG: dienelactone hydrolase family protein [Actinomycetota bacterium]